MKKFLITLLMLVVCAAFAASALAEPVAGDRFDIEEGYLTVTIPEGYYVLTPDMDESYTFLQDFEADIDALKSYMIEQKIFLDLYSEDMSHEIIIMVQTPAEAGIPEDEAFDYDEIPENYREEMLEGVMESSPSIQGYTLEFTAAEFEEINGVAWVRAKANMTDGSSVVSDRLQYSTCQNGVILNVNLFSYDGSSAASFQHELDTLMGGITIGTRPGYTPPAVPTASVGGGILSKVLIGALSGAVTGLIVGVVCKNKKKQAEAAARAATAQGFHAQNYYEGTPTMRYPDQDQ